MFITTAAAVCPCVNPSRGAGIMYGAAAAADHQQCDNKYAKHTYQRRRRLVGQWGLVLALSFGTSLLVLSTLMSVKKSNFNAFSEDPGHTRKFADQHLQTFLKIARDPDCTTRTLDASDPALDWQEARTILRKCKMVVLRNLYRPNDLRTYEQEQLNPFLLGLQSGRISQKGGTTNGDSYFMPCREAGRHEVILPQEVLDPTLLTNAHLLNVLRHDTVLGHDAVLHSAGVNLAEGRSVGQMWHIDESYPFGPFDAFANFGVAGHDLGAYAVTVLVPLLDLHRSHGPTEFCLGMSALQGLPIYDDAQMLQLVQDQSLLMDPLYRKVVSLGNQVCPPELWRSPVVSKGDVVLFDYQMTHRGGWNNSPETRAVLFFTFSRIWYKDGNFRNRLGTLPTFDYLVQTARLAKPDFSRRCSDCAEHESPEACHQRSEATCHVETSFDLKQFTTINPVEGSTSASADVEGEESFTVSNKDVKDGVLYLNERKIVALVPGESYTFQAKIGDTFALHSPTGKLSWPVRYRGHVVFSADMVGNRKDAHSR